MLMQTFSTPPNRARGTMGSRLGGAHQSTCGRVVRQPLCQ